MRSIATPGSPTTRPPVRSASSASVPSGFTFRESFAFALRAIRPRSRSVSCSRSRGALVLDLEDLLDVRGDVDAAEADVLPREHVGQVLVGGDLLRGVRHVD